MEISTKKNIKNHHLFEETNQESGPGSVSSELKSQNLLYPSSFSSSSCEDVSPNLCSPYPHFRSEPEVLSSQILDRDQESILNSSVIDNDHVESPFSPLLLPHLPLSSTIKDLSPPTNHVYINTESRKSFTISTSVPVLNFTNSVFIVLFIELFGQSEDTAEEVDLGRAVTEAVAVAGAVEEDICNTEIKNAKEVPQNNPSVSKDKDRDEITLKALPNRQGSFQKKNDQNQDENKNVNENSNSSSSCRNNSNSSDIKSERADGRKVEDNDHHTGLCAWGQLGLYATTNGSLSSANCVNKYPNIFSAVVLDSGVFDLIRYQEMDPVPSFPLDSTSFLQKNISSTFLPSALSDLISLLLLLFLQLLLLLLSSSAFLFSFSFLFLF